MHITDGHGNRLPQGTVVDLMPHSPHTGIIGYANNGQQVVAHNSKKYGKAVVTFPEEFNDGSIPVRYTRLPVHSQEGARIWQNATNDVARGVRWLPGDNCQDFASRAVAGHNGSPTRDKLVGIGALAAIVWLASKLLD